MKTYPLCEPYAWEDPRALLSAGFTWRQRKEGPCSSEVANHIIFVYLVAVVIGLLLQAVFPGTQTSFLAVAIGLATLVSLPAYWTLIRIRADYTEGFQADAKAEKERATGALATEKEETKRVGRELADSLKPTGVDAFDVYEVIGMGAAPASLTLPTARNPFMNVLVDEIKYHPTRGAAASIYDPSVKVTLDDFFRTEFYSDPTDVFGRSQSQRQFVSMPSTSIPNDQDSYQKWLYKIPGKTCKEGGREACLPGTDGGALPWLNRDA